MSDLTCWIVETVVGAVVAVSATYTTFGLITLAAPTIAVTKCFEDEVLLHGVCTPVDDFIQVEKD